MPATGSAGAGAAAGDPADDVMRGDVPAPAVEDATAHIDATAPRGPGGGLPVRVRGLTWRPFGRRDPVLAGVDLDVAAGERVLLVGPSGSGKSTLLRALAGVLETADSGDRAGTVTVGGVDPHAQPGVAGLVLQDPGAGIVAATCARDVAFGLENRRTPRDEMAPVVASCLDAVGLAHLADAPTSTLSGGESQRLALAGALALNPGVLLLDEPLAMLDAATRADVVDAVVRAAHGRTLVVVEHRLGPWLPHVDRLLVMDDAGAVVADGDPATVLATERERLLDLGVWVPGEPDPEPVGVPAGLLPAPTGGRVVARGVAVDRVAQPANRPPRVVRAVEDVDLEVDAGQAVALVGASGSGKSSLLLALAGLEPVAQGVVRVGGRSAGVQPAAAPPAPVVVLRPGPGAAAQDADDTSARPAAGARPIDTAGAVDGDDPATLDPQTVPARVAWVPQSPAAGLVERTVLAEVQAGPAATGHPLTDDAARALLDVVGLAPLADQQTAALSGGEQRRLAVVAAVAARPGVLLTDEMTIGQDRRTWAAVVGLAQALRDAGAAVVHATHDASLVARCDAVRELPVRPAPAQTRARTSLAVRGGPLALVLVCALALGAALSVDGWRSGLAGLAVEAVLGAVALWAPGDRSLPAPGGRLRTLTWRLGPMLLAALGIAWSTWLLGGHRVPTAAEAGLRLLVMVVPSAVLLPLVDPDALGDHLAQRAHLPARPVVALSAALQRLQDMADLRTTLTRARRMRGLPTGGRAIGSIAFAVLVEVLGSASRLALAMDARGFAAAHRRTWAAPAPWTLASSLVLALGLVPWAVVLLVR